MMLKNYFIIAWRNIQRNKLYTILNITGLAFGLAVFISALLYVNFETGFDRWDIQLNRVYRVAVTETRRGETNSNTGTPYSLGLQLQANAPGVQSVTHIIPYAEQLVSGGGKQLYIDKIMAADSSFFTVFPYKFVYGSPLTALSQRNQVAISSELSRKLFGDNNPLGNLLKIAGGNTYSVAGVFESSGTSHLNFDICLSYFNKAPNYWGRQFFHTYILLKPGTQATNLEATAKNLMTSGEASYSYNNLISDNPKIETPGAEPDKWLRKNTQTAITSVFFEKVADIHLSPKTSAWTDAAANHPLINASPGNATPVIFFAIAAVLVLLLACINYINLSIARSGKRAKETGVRKVMGAMRPQLIGQFMAEALLQTLVALLLGLLMARGLIFLINGAFAMHLTFFGKILSTQSLRFCGQLSLIAILVTFLSGAYPAFILSSANPVAALKGETTKNIKGKLLRNGLVILQFGISACFIVGMMIVYKQLNYINNADPGFSTEQVVILKPYNSGILDINAPDQKIGLIKNRLLQIPGVESVSLTDAYPGKPSLDRQGASYDDRHSEMTFDYIHFNYFKTLGMTILHGRDLSPAYAADTVNSAIINQTAARVLGYPEPVGRSINILGRNYNIVGVLKDNHIAGFNTAIAPEIYAIGANKGMLSGYGNILVKVSAHSALTALAAISNEWKSIEPGFPLRTSWLDADFAKLLDKYERFGKLTALLSIVSTVIALMGIFALSAFAAAQRTKEIGVRKVFGASIAGIILMLSRDFLKLIAIALLIAFPVAYLAADNWLQQFAYRISPGPITFVIAGSAVMLIALLTVSIHAVKTAMLNPIKSLRTE